MIEYVRNITNFWEDDLKIHEFARQVPFVAKNFEHLDRKFYNSGYLLQSFNDELVNAEGFKKVLDVAEGSVSWTCILPNLILPTHSDTFYTLREQHSINIDRCFRYLIFLEDWTFGHHAGFEKLNITNWKAGDVWIFDSKEAHYGVNASNVPFYSCQVSSFK